jgi:hypothetical protein
VKVDYQVPNYWKVGEWFYGDAVSYRTDLSIASQPLMAIDEHGAGSADGAAARRSESDGCVLMV